MKLAVISDIHGNYKALEAFLAYAEQMQPDGIICLGDYVTDSPYPERTMTLLYDMMQTYRCYMVRGNREEYLINNVRKPQGWKPSSSTGALWYTAAHVGQEDIRFFESLKICDLLKISGFPALTICHGSPDEVRGNFEENPALKDACLKKLETDFLLGGHSHHQETDVRYGKTYVNPGSLGLAIDGVGRQAQFAVLKGENGTWVPELFSIPYDADGFLKDFTASGLDEYGMVLNRAIKKTLVTGVNYFYHSVTEAWKISGMPVNETSEEVWQQVAKRLEF